MKKIEMRMNFKKINTHNDEHETESKKKSLGKAALIQ